MPSRVRVAGVIRDRAYLGRQLMGYLHRVAESAGVLITSKKKGTTWQDILRVWEILGKYLDGDKLYVIRERRGVHPGRSLFNQKLLGYKRNKKKKVAELHPWVIENPFQNNVDQPIGREEAIAPPPEQPREARRERYWQGHIVE